MTKNTWKTVLVILIALAFVFVLFSFDGDEEEAEEVVELSVEEEAIAEYWEARYTIPNGVMQPVSGSTAFSEIGYDSKNSALIVRFKSSGKAYVYIDFPVSEWKAFTNAKSLGSYYNKNIKGKYTSYKIARD